MQNLSIADIFETSLRLLRDNLLQILLLAALIVGVPSLVFGGGFLDADIAGRGIWEGFSLSGLVLMLAQAVLHAAVTLGLLRQLKDPTAPQNHQSLPDLLAESWKSIGAVIGVSLVKGFVIGLLTMLCIATGWLILPLAFGVAALWFAARWFVAVPAAVNENLGVAAALSRSTRLTQGLTWQLMGFLVVLWLIGVVGAKIISFVLGIVALSGLGATIALLVMAALDATIAVVVYHRLSTPSAKTEIAVAG